MSGEPSSLALAPSLFFAQHLASLLLGQSSVVVALLLGLLVLGLGAPVWHAAVQLELRGHLVQQALLFLAGLLHSCCGSWHNGCPLLSTLAFSSAFWLFVHKEVRWQQALPLQAAQTAVAAGVCLSKMPLSSSSEVAHTVLCCMAVGLVVPAAVFWDGERQAGAGSEAQLQVQPLASRSRLHSSSSVEQAADSEQDQQQHPDQKPQHALAARLTARAAGHPAASAAAAAAAAPLVDWPHASKHEGPSSLLHVRAHRGSSTATAAAAAAADAKLGGAGEAVSPKEGAAGPASGAGGAHLDVGHLSHEELLQVLRELVAAGLLSPFSVHQHEAALRLRSTSGGQLFEGGLASSTCPHSSASLSSHGPSTRPSTSFSSSSMGLDPSFTTSSFWLSSAGMHAAAAAATATTTSRSSTDLCATPSAHQQDAPLLQQQQLPLPQLPHLVPMLPRPTGAPLLSSQPPSPTHPHTHASSISGSSCSHVSTQTVHDGASAAQLLLPVCRHRPGRSCTAASLLDPPTEGLPPIVEAAQEGSAQLPQGGDAQAPASDGPLAQMEEVGTHKTWPPCHTCRLPLLGHADAGHAQPVSLPHCEDSRRLGRGVAPHHLLMAPSPVNNPSFRGVEGATCTVPQAATSTAQRQGVGRKRSSSGGSSSSRVGEQVAGGGGASSQGEQGGSVSRSSAAVDASLRELLHSGSGELSVGGNTYSQTHCQGSTPLPLSHQGTTVVGSSPAVGSSQAGRAHRSSSSPGHAAEPAAAAVQASRGARVSEGGVRDSLTAGAETAGAPTPFTPCTPVHTHVHTHTTPGGAAGLQSHPPALTPTTPSSLASLPGSPRAPAAAPPPPPAPSPWARALSRSSSTGTSCRHTQAGRQQQEEGQQEPSLALLREDSIGAWLDQQVQLSGTVHQPPAIHQGEASAATTPPHSSTHQPRSISPHHPHPQGPTHLLSTPSPGDTTQVAAQPAASVSAQPASRATLTRQQPQLTRQKLTRHQPASRATLTRQQPARAAAAAAAAARSPPAAGASSHAHTHSHSSGSSSATGAHAQGSGSAQAQAGLAPAWTGSSRQAGSKERSRTAGVGLPAHAGTGGAGGSGASTAQGGLEVEGSGGSRRPLVQGPTLYPPPAASKAAAGSAPRAFNSSFCFDNPPASSQPHSLRRQQQPALAAPSDPPASGPASASAAAKALLHTPGSRSQAASLELHHQPRPSLKRNRVVSLELYREREPAKPPNRRGASLDHPAAGVLSSRASAPSSRRVSFASHVHERVGSPELRARNSAGPVLQGGGQALSDDGHMEEQPQTQQRQQLQQQQDQPQHLQQQEPQQEQHHQHQHHHQQQSPGPACGSTLLHQPTHPPTSIPAAPRAPSSPLSVCSPPSNDTGTPSPLAGSLQGKHSSSAHHEPQQHAVAPPHQHSLPATDLQRLGSSEAGESQHEGAPAARVEEAAVQASEMPLVEPDQSAQLGGQPGEPEARRLAARNSSRTLLKHTLPENMLTNIQMMPAKVADQQQPGQYAGSNTQVVTNRKARPTGDSSELEVENTIISNRRYLDASKALLDEVQVNKILGFGSMGMVYFGVLWDTKVVVKMIEHGAGLLGKEQNRGKLARSEAVLSRMLLHPNVVITYDCCTGMMDASRLQVSGTPSRALRSKAGRQRQMTVMVQEFCDAGTLSDALQKQRHGLDKANPAYPELVMQLALDIANGIKYMHSLRVLHMDLKAENILLTHSNSAVAPAHSRLGGLTAKVADLGLALVLSLEDDEVQSGIHGTVSHMPPEAMHNTTFSMATDIYSFGVVLWELITQDKPFAGLKPHQVVEAVCDFNERPAWPKAMDPRLAGLRDLANRCWDACPQSRPSIFEVIDCLHEVVDPSQAMRRTEMGSLASEESDELELALRSQPQQPHMVLPQEKAVTHTAEAAQERQPATAAAAAVQPARSMRASSAGHKRRSSLGSRRASSASGGILHAQAEGQKRARGLQDIMAAGPPRDMLSRMLYYLAQVPPQPEQLQRVEVGGGIVRVAVSVDMSNISVRGPR